MKVKVINSLFKKCRKAGFFRYFGQILANIAGDVIMAESSFYFAHNKQSFCYVYMNSLHQNMKKIVTSQRQHLCKCDFDLCPRVYSTDQKILF